MITNIIFKKLNDEAIIPEYAHEGDSCMDVFSVIDHVLKPNEYFNIPTGLACSMDKNIEIQVRPKSGIASKNGVTVLNTPGTIDAGFRGEIGVLLINLSNKDFEIQKGMKIAQLAVCPVYRAKITESDTLDETERGQGGWGSTGLFKFNGF